MLTAQALSMPFAGGFFGTAAVENLQRAMLALAQAANWPLANPGPIDGVVGTTTIAALGGIIQSVPDIPSNLKSILAVALAAAQFNANAKAEAIQLIETYAAQLTTAITAMVAKYGGGSPPASGDQGSGMPTSTTLPARRIVGGGIIDNYLLPPGTRVASPPKTYSTTPASPGTMPTASFWAVPPGTPWYRNWKIWAGVGGAIVAGGIVYKVVT